MQCIHCRRENANGSAYCIYCGKPIKQDENTSAAAIAPILLSGEAEKLELMNACEPSCAAQEEGERTEAKPVPGNPAIETKAPGFTVFSPKGRLNRIQYLYFLIINFIASGLLMAGITYAGIGAGAGSAPAYLSALYYPVFIVLLTVRIITIIKRFHDINKPGYHIFLLLIPCYNLYVFFQLLLERPKNEINAYGGYERRSWFWQVPVAVMLVPLLYFSTCFGLTQGRELLAASGSHNGGYRYYSEDYRLGLTFPEGWSKHDIGGCLHAEQNWNGTQAISLSVADAKDTISLDRYTDEDMEELAAKLTDTDTLAANYASDPSEISSVSWETVEINGKPFIKIEFLCDKYSTWYRIVSYVGIYDETAINLQSVVSVNSEAQSSETVKASVFSLRMGSDATAEYGDQ